MASSLAFKMVFCLTWLVILVAISFGSEQSKGDECHISPVIHVLQYSGCIPKPIPSFACQGRCTSYVQVSGYKLWQTERSCMCCQEMGVREATVNLYCPKAKQGEPKFRKVVTRAPVDCMCRPCTAIDENLTDSRATENANSVYKDISFDELPM
ncbi:hypothetical protein CHUAL_003817 [Chamberlinius hualienensis]